MDHKRLTLSPGLRWDYFNSSLPAQSAPAGRFVPARSFPEVPDLPNWNNVVPRFGWAYDLTGSGRTAMKGNFGLYVSSQGTGFATTYNPNVSAIDQRTWTDLNRDDIAQENEIGPTSNLNFGVRRNQNPDPDISRPYQLVGDVGIQHELFSGFGLSVSYNRRRFTTTSGPRTSRSNPRGLHAGPDSRPARATERRCPSTTSRQASWAWSTLDTTRPPTGRGIDGVDVTINLRWRGVDAAGRNVHRADQCRVICEVEDPNSLRFCDQTLHDVPLLTQFKLAGTYLMPYGIRLSGNFQSQPGNERIINYAVVRSVLPTLTQTSVNVRLNEPGSALQRSGQPARPHHLEVLQERGRGAPAGTVGVQRAQRQPRSRAGQHVRAIAGQGHDDSQSAGTSAGLQREVLKGRSSRRSGLQLPAEQEES